MRMLMILVNVRRTRSRFEVEKVEKVVLVVRLSSSVLVRRCCSFKGRGNEFLWIKNRPWLLIVLMGRGEDLSVG